MPRLVIEVLEDDVDLASGLLFEAGATGLEQRDLPTGTVLIVHGDDALLSPIEAALTEARLRGLENEHHREPDDDSWKTRWVNAVQAHYLTDDLVMVPEGEPDPAEQAAVLRFRPGWAFGTGGHATTRLAAECLAECLRRRPRARLLDVGTGSGVLALAAVSWGALHALGLDCDPRAVEVARANAHLNGFSERAHFDETPLERIDDSFDVVVANIDQPTLLSLAPDLARHTRGDGELVVTGLLEEHQGELVERFGECGMEVFERRERDGWSLLRVRHTLGKTPQS